eukprot:GHVR01180672.1.p1 GENE.GHVR01180672.1~~GHVR01180672.1.p1  ORF type:complete len:108 (+),score=6.46 GHVR01180672.1:4693-5016(+)
MKQKSLPLFTTSQLLNSINLLKPYVDLPKAPEIKKSLINIKAEKILTNDIITDLNTIFEAVKEIIKTKEGLIAIKDTIILQIQRYNVLGNYNYAYLLDEIDDNELSI